MWNKKFTSVSIKGFFLFSLLVFLITSPPVYAATTEIEIIYAESPGNQAPVLSPIGARSVNEGSLLQFTVSATDPDGDILTYSASNLPTGASFNAGTQTFSWTPTYDQAGTYSAVRFSVTDGSLTSFEELTITVNNVVQQINQAPVLGAIGNRTVNEGSLLQFTITATDPDGDALTYSASNLPSGASFNPANQTFSWTPNTAQAGTYANVRFQVSDGSLTDFENITITVNNVNQAPVLNPIGDRSIDESQLLQFTVLGSDPDGDSLTYSASNLPAGASFVPNTRTFSWTPLANQVGTYANVGFSVTDAGLTDAEAITITVRQVVDTTPCSVEELNPEPNEVQVPVDTNIIFHLKDAGTGVNRNTLNLNILREGDASPTSIILNGASQLTTYPNSVAIQGTPNDYVVLYAPPKDSQYQFNYEQDITLTINASDLRGNAMQAYTSRFTTAMLLRGANLKVVDADRPGITQDNSSIATDNGGKNIYVAWQEDSGIWFSQSEDRGITFAKNIKVSEGLTGIQQRPVIAIDEPGDIFILWQGQDTAGNFDLYFARKLKDEATFSSGVVPIDLVLGVSNQTQPSVVCSNNGNVFIAWVNGTSGVYYAKSRLKGESLWQILLTDMLRVDDATATLVQEPSLKLSASGQNKYLAWSAEKIGKSRIYFNQFDNRDAKLSANDIQVSDDATSDAALKPALSVRPGGGQGAAQVNFCVVWENTKDADTNIFFDKSANGTIWGTDVQVNEDAVTPQTQRNPAVAVDNNGDVYVAWTDLRNQDPDIYLALSIDKGRSFKTNLLINDDTGTAIQDNPDLALTANGKHAVISWTDYRNLDADIYFNRNSFYDEDNSSSLLVDNTLRTNLRADKDLEIERTEIEIQPLRLKAPTTLGITRVESVPELKLNNNTKLVGKVVDFSPGGLQFKEPVTIKIPYTQADLDRAGAVAPSLKIYYYNLKTLLWEEILGSSVDTANQLVQAPTTHFSLFGLVGSAGAGSGGDDGKGKGKCLIATAAYGTKDAAQIEVLRSFRDKYLLTNNLGKHFVNFYYRHSPPLADYISQRQWARRLTRAVLKPVVWSAKRMVK